MAKYQLADLVNGNFGEIFGTIEEAESALDDVVAENLETEKEVIILDEERDADRECREPEDFTQEELARRAEKRIRKFHSVEEIEEE